jgi:hypothetical protein
MNFPVRKRGSDHTHTLFKCKCRVMLEEQGIPQISAARHGAKEHLFQKRPVPQAYDTNSRYLPSIWKKQNEPPSPSILCQEEIPLDQKQSLWETCLVTKSTQVSQKDC